MDVEQVRPLLLNCAEEFIHELQRRRAEVLNGRVKINRMNRNHRWQPGHETVLHLRHQSFQIAPLCCGLHFDGTKSGKHSVSIQIWARSLARAVLHYAHSSFEPGRSRIRICTIARRTGTEGTRSKQLPENSRRALDRGPLVVHCQESAYGPHLRVPVLIHDPRHSPVNVWSLCMPQFLDQLRPLSTGVQFSRHRPLAKMSQPM